MMALIYSCAPIRHDSEPHTIPVRWNWSSYIVFSPHSYCHINLSFPTLECQNIFCEKKLFILEFLTCTPYYQLMNYIRHTPTIIGGKKKFKWRVKLTTIFFGGIKAIASGVIPSTCSCIRADNTMSSRPAEHGEKFPKHCSTIIKVSHMRAF